MKYDIHRHMDTFFSPAQSDLIARLANKIPKDLCDELFTCARGITSKQAKGGPHSVHGDATTMCNSPNLMTINATNTAYAVYVNEQNYLVLVDLPGMQKEKLHISIEDGVLLIESNREVPDNIEHRCIFSNRPHGKVKILVELPADVNIDKVSPSYTNGVLNITIERQRPVSNARSYTVV